MTTKLDVYNESMKKISEKKHQLIAMAKKMEQLGARGAMKEIMVSIRMLMENQDEIIDWIREHQQEPILINFLGKEKPKFTDEEKS